VGTPALCCETRMLGDRYSIGYVCFNGNEYQGRHEPLIPLELFHRVQQVMDEQSGSGVGLIGLSGKETGEPGDL
jgi:hypothetical protein